jgi:tripeptidyl-peptidase-1
MHHFLTCSYDGASDAFLTWITSTASMASPPLVQSISYSVQESDLTSSYMQVFNVQAMKLGAMGVTIVVSSRDDGAPGFFARGAPSRCSYDPQFPASSPYVVAVGKSNNLLHYTTEVRGFFLLRILFG